MSINEKKLNKMMDELGFRESHLGTPMIREGVRIVDKNPDALICKDIYPVLGGGTRSGINNAERNMRAAIQSAMRNPNWGTVWRGLGGWNKPTTREVVWRLAREAKYED